MDKFDLQIMHPLLSIQTILQVQISLEINQHSTAYLHLVLSDDRILKKFNALHQSSIAVKQGDTPLFYGIIQNTEISQEVQFTHITIQAISGTWLMDQDCKQRSFQNTSMCYAELVDKVCCIYQGYHAMMESNSDETIGIPLIQYEETDWAFLQRVASHQNAVLVPDVYVSSPSFHFGFPQQTEALIIEKTQYTTGISPKWATQSKHQKQDYLYYKIEEKVNYPIGKQVQLNGRILWIIGKDIRLEHGMCVYDYTLGGPAFFYRKVQYNQHITGLSILGTVLESSGETVKLHLDIDDEQDVGTAYPYWWTPPTGNLMYCIPEVGTRVSLYFGCQDESCAKAVNCVRTNASSYEGFSDPTKRSLSTVKGGAFDLYPTCTCLHNTSNLLSLDDNGGIIISSQLPISMIAPKISIEAETQLSISAKSQVAIAKMNSVMAEPLSMLSLFNQIDTLSQQFTQVEGSFKEPLQQIQDEPQKGEIDWGKLALNVLGGLAVVALACTGVGLVFGGGLVLGCAIGGAVAVGACAVGDIASGNVSGFENYAYAALSGVVTGAIFSGVSGCSLFTKLGNMKSLLGKVGQSALLGGTGFGVGTLDSMGRQYVRSGTIDYQQALMDGALMGGVAGGGYLLSQFGPVNKLFGKLADTPFIQKIQQLDQKITQFFDDKRQAMWTFPQGGSKCEQVYLGDLMSPEDAARYDEYWRRSGIGSDKTYNNFSKDNPGSNIDDYFKLVKEQSPWPDNYNPFDNIITMKEGDTFNMVLDLRQPIKYPGGFGILDDVPSVDFARNDMAIKVTWKSDCGKVVTYRIKAGIELQVPSGPIGPQIDLTANKYLPGNKNLTQLDLFYGLGKIDRNQYIEYVPNSMKLLH